MSHVKNPDLSVYIVLTQGLQSTLVNHLSDQVKQQLVALNENLSTVTLTTAPDARRCAVSKKDGNLRTGLLYKLLKNKSKEFSPLSTFI